ncbi:integration host factor, partial [Tsukamurella tyrosinosolvens]|uniref:integration host factor, actinobacterial type n=1 Tax=Tsukamurella tyrosinosolvens TaxID=57704 RepID=UPI00079196D9
KSGKASFADVLGRSGEPLVAKMKVSALLESLPKFGKVRVAEPMDELGIAPTRRVAGLGERQRAALLERFGG